MKELPETLAEIAQSLAHVLAKGAQCSASGAYMNENRTIREFHGVEGHDDRRCRVIGLPICFGDGEMIGRSKRARWELGFPPVGQSSHLAKMPRIQGLGFNQMAFLRHSPIAKVGTGKMAGSVTGTASGFANVLRPGVDPEDAAHLLVLTSGASHPAIDGTVEKGVIATEPRGQIVHISRSVIAAAHRAHSVVTEKVKTSAIFDQIADRPE